MVIKAFTHIDRHGRSYYRRAVSEGWRRLRSAADYADLNRAIDLRA